MHVEELIEENPSGPAFDANDLARAIKACFACEESCSSCADACLGEESPSEMVRCIRLDLICADVCGAMGRALSRQGTPAAAVAQLLVTCRAIAEECATECARHDHEHCQLCADACRACVDACSALLEDTGS